jgi:hemerythrin-like domain-containing protein
MLFDEHRELEERLEHLWAGGDADDLHAQTTELVELLRMHSRLEERLVYPLVARVEGRARAREEAEDHLTMRELMEELQELMPGGTEWQARLLTLEDLVIAHVQEAEHLLLPRLSTALDAQAQDDVRHELSMAREELLARTQSGPFPGTSPLLEALRWDG